MAHERRKSEIMAERGHRLPLALEVRLVAHCVRLGDPAAGVVADAVASFLDDFLDGVAEDAAPAPTQELTYEPDPQAELPFAAGGAP